MKSPASDMPIYYSDKRVHTNIDGDNTHNTMSQHVSPLIHPACMYMIMPLEWFTKNKHRSLHNSGVKLRDFPTGYWTDKSSNAPGVDAYDAQDQRLERLINKLTSLVGNPLPNKSYIVYS